MTFDDYQARAKKTASYGALKEHKWAYPALGLAGESGEVANKLKKVLRDNDGHITEEIRQSVKDELGDVLWYVSQLALELGFSLEEIGQDNLAKLGSRHSRGVIQGKGDNR